MPPRTIRRVCALVLASVGTVAVANGQPLCERPRQALELVADEARRTSAAAPSGLSAAAALARTGAACYGVDRDRRGGGTPGTRSLSACALADYDDSLRSFDLFAPADLPAPDSTWFALFFATRGFHHLRLGHAARALDDYGAALAYAVSRPGWLRAPLVVDAATAHLCAGDPDAALHAFRRANALLPRDSLDAPPYTLLRALADHGAAAALVGLASPPEDALARAAARLEAAGAAYAGARLPSLEAAVATLHAEAVHRLRRPLRDVAVRLDAAAALAERHGDTDAIVRTALLRARIATERNAELDVPGVLEAAYERSVLTDRFSLPTLQVLNALGRWHERQHHHDAARHAYERARRIVDVQRARRSPETPPRLLLDEEQVPFRGLSRLLLAARDTVGAFRTLEEARGRYLQDLRTHRRLAARLVGADRVQYERLSAAIERVRDELAVASAPAHRAALHGEEARLVLTRTNLVRRATSRPAPTLPALRTALAARGAVLVSYALPDGGVGEAHAFVVGPAGLRAVPLPGATEAQLRMLVDRISPALQAPDTGGELQASRFSLGALHELHRLVVAPLADLLPEGAPLVVIPEGPLVELPFGLLLEAPATDYRRASYLLRRHAVSVELAASFLLEPARPPGTGLVAFGRTAFADAGPGETGRLRALPDAGAEVVAAASRFAGGHVRLNDEATEPAFLAALRTASVVHVASHAVVRAVDPALSGVVLAPGPGADGIVYAHELQAEEARADLVVLSGCATARGRYRPGEGMTGLQYALRASGVPATVATLWRVDDAAMRRVLSVFYDHLADGMLKDEALRRAQLAYLDDAGPVAASPYFWAAPVLYGDPAPSGAATKYSSLALPPSAYGFALALLAGGALVRAVRRRSVRVRG